VWLYACGCHRLGAIIQVHDRGVVAAVLHYFQIRCPRPEAFWITCAGRYAHIRSLGYAPSSRATGRNVPSSSAASHHIFFPPLLGLLTPQCCAPCGSVSQLFQVLDQVLVTLELPFEIPRSLQVPTCLPSNRLTSELSYFESISCHCRRTFACRSPVLTSRTQDSCFRR